MLVPEDEERIYSFDAMAVDKNGYDSLFITDDKYGCKCDFSEWLLKETNTRRDKKSTDNGYLQVT